jgi:hypothetical protein
MVVERGVLWLALGLKLTPVILEPGETTPLIEELAFRGE